MWKIPAALERFASVYGTEKALKPQNYTFLYNSTGYIQSCVHLPYMFIVGNFDMDLSAKIVNSTACALYEHRRQGGGAQVQGSETEISQFSRSVVSDSL